MMQQILIISVAAAAAYLLGAIPCGLLVAGMRGVDIRSVGSGNIGATNVFRSVGKTWGILTFMLDALKGFIPAFVFPMLISRWLENPDPLINLFLGAAAVIGHNWPVYLRFKGGKGVATSAGMLLGVAPVAVGIAMVVWIMAVTITRYVSVASILAALSVAICSWIFYRTNGIALPIILTLLAGLAIYKHKANIGRLLNGTENRFGKR